jgi:hypothetical protein
MSPKAKAKLLPCCALILSLTATQAPAQTAGTADPAAPVDAGRTQLEHHLKLVRGMYNLNADQIAELRPRLISLLPSQQEFDARTALTRRRLRIARTLLAKGENLNDAERAEKMAPFDRHYRRLVARAPLSIANIAKQAEALLSEEQIANARKRIKTKFADRLKADDAKLDFESIDALLSGPIPPGRLPQMSLASSTLRFAQPEATTIPKHPVAQAPPSKAQKPAPSRRTAPRSINPMATATDMSRHDVKATPSKARANRSLGPPKPLKPAPPESQWAKYVEDHSTRLGFNDQQKAIAASVLESCRSRASTHREQKKAEYESAEKIADSAEKTKRLGELNYRVNVLYDELTRRIDAIPSVEQKQMGEKGQAPKAKPAKTESSASPPSAKKEPAKAPKNEPSKDKPQKTEPPKAGAPKKESP